MQIADNEPATVTVRIMGYSSSRLMAELESPYQPNLTLDLEGSGSSEEREFLRQRLISLTKPIRGRLDLDWEEAYRTIDALRDLGSVLSSSMLFGPKSGARFRTYIRQCLAKFRVTHDLHTVPILQLEAPWNWMIPIEFYKLRTYGSGDSSLANNVLDLRNRVRDLLGFQFVVRRRFPRVQSPPLAAKQRISMRFFWDSSLAGAAQEWSYLPKLSEGLTVDPPWPAEVGDDSASFVQMAYGPPANVLGGLVGAGGSSSADIWHLACHCSTKADFSADYFFRFRSVLHGPVDVSLSDLQTGFSDLEEDGVDPWASKPLIFMNACGSSRVYPFSSSSFPQFWLEHGFAGCIGTEIEVDDLVAARFSRYFYNAIVNGQPLGAASYKARMELVERHRNPLGILWTFYADPRSVLVREAPD